MNIAIFYHLYQVNNDYWRTIYDEQMNKLCFSELYNATDFIYIGINGDKKLDYCLPRTILHRNTYLDSEADTLAELWNFAYNNPDYKILYFYCKGVTHLNEPTMFTKNSWRLYLEYFNIIRWKDCVKKLDNYDCVGTEFLKESNYWDDNNNWRTEQNWHYSGNFWWSNSNYIKNLDPNYLYSDEYGNRYNRSEFWIGQKKPNYYSFYNTNAECRYGHEYNPYEYMKI